MVAQAQIITVSGAAARPVTPDRATLALIAEGTGATVGQAIAAHAAEVGRVVQALIGCGVPEASIHGSAPRIIEQDAPGLPSATQRGITASRVAATITVSLDNLDRLADVVDHAIGAGAAFGGIVFTLRDEAAIRQQTLAAALLDAHTTAAAIAAAYGKPLTDALGIAEESVAFDGSGEYAARVRVTYAMVNV